MDLKTFEFSSKMIVGIKSIDDQHRRLVEGINTLMDAMKRAEGEQALGKMLRGLIRYSLVHFEMEEDLMKKYQYPDVESHLSAHDAFRQRIKKFEEEFVNGGKIVAVHLGNYLCDWLVKHIMATDKHLAAHLVNKGV